MPGKGEIMPLIITDFNSDVANMEWLRVENRVLVWH